MPAPLDLTGQTFGRLTVVRLVEGTKLRSWVCVCACDPGRELPPVRTANLTRGNTRSCGCLQREKAKLSGRAAAIHTHTRPKTCPQCGRDFLGTIKQRYCRRACKEAALLVEKRRRNCAACGAAYDAASRKVYCSDPCRNRSNRCQRGDGSLTDQMARIEAAVQERSDG